MPKAFPTFLYVKREKTDGTRFFVADDDPDALCEQGATVRIARYRLIDDDEYKLVRQKV